MSAVASIRDRWSRLTGLDMTSGDTGEDALRRRSLTLMASIIVFLAPVWIVVYALLGRPVAATIPFVYWVLTIVGLVRFRRSRRPGGFALSQTALMLVLPFLLQWSLGGFANASAVMIWAFASPMGALVWFGPRAALPWFVAFVGLAVVSGLVDPVVAAGATPLPEPIRVFFFVANIAATGSVAWIVLQFFVRGRDRAQAALGLERERSERLLRNILPEPIAERLKGGEQRIADRYDEVTVLFADIVDFTPLAARLTPQEVIELLDRVFSALDALAERCGLEKIKTVGDAYMAVSGAPVERANHAIPAAEMALDIHPEVDAAMAGSGHVLHLRVGLHSGPVVAGVIGTRKFAYDLWGDAVNIASRMESHGLPGSVQVSDATRALLQDGYVLEPRGTVAIKGRGEMRTWLLVGRRSDLAGRGASAPDRTPPHRIDPD